MYFNHKPKVFVRFYPGASGYFFSLLLHNLAQDVAEMPKDRYSEHMDHPIISQGHNFEQNYEYDTNLNNKFSVDYGFGDVFKLNESVSHLTEKCKFIETANAIYTIPTHTLNPIKLITAFPTSTYNTKLINIQHSPSDLSQILYNIVIKNVIAWRRIDSIKHIANNMLKKYPEKSKNPKFNIDDTVFEDTRFLCYLCKDFIESPAGFYSEFLENTMSLTSLGINHLTIPFSSINDLSLISYIDVLVDYIGIETTPERKNNAIELIHKYSAAQIENPYPDIHIDDY